MREMKDSGIDLIGSFPKIWDIRRLKYLCTIETGNQDTQDADPDGIYPFYVRSPIVERSTTYTFNGEGILMAGDGAGAGRIFHHAFGKYAVHQRVYRLSNFEDINSNFLFYFLEILFTESMDKGSAQSTVPSVRLPMLKNFDICVPTLDEQKAIVDFLDRKCSEIDSLTADIEKQIETLEQYKKSIITEAVTKGLDPDAEMKDSGAEWIGKIPKEWEIGKVAFLYDVTLGKMIQPVQLHDSDTLEYYLCAVNLGQNRLKLDNLKQMWISPQEKKNLQLNKGDLVVVEGGDVASCDIIPYDLNNIYFQNSIMRVCGRNGNDNRIMKYVLMVAKSSGHIDLMCNKATIAHFTKEKLMSLQIPMIPVSEQKVIADYLDDKCTEIDGIIADKQSQLDTLAEYKKSLIYEYVTGKIEVPIA